jgi:hypothetical protein
MVAIGYCISVVAFVPLPLQKFVCPPHCYYLMQEIENYKFGEVFNGKRYISNLIKIRLMI